MSIVVHINKMPDMNVLYSSYVMNLWFLNLCIESTIDFMYLSIDRVQLVLEL